MATKHTNFMRATIWTPTMKSEIEGSPDAVIGMAFCALSTYERREKCLSELQQAHVRMTGREETAQPPTELHP